MFMSSMGEGMAMGFPDVCKTPTPAGPIPLPYPNISETILTMPDSACMLVLADMMPTNHILSSTVTSEGNEPGIAGGVVSQMDMGPQMYILGSETVLLEGMPAQRLTSITGHNGEEPNIVGVMMVPSQVFVLALA